MSRSSPTVGLPLVCCLVLGCAEASGPAHTPTSPAAPSAASGLERIEIDSPGVLLVKPGNRLGDYDALMLGPVFVRFQRGSDAPGDAPERIREYLKQSILAAARAGNLPVVAEAGPCVLRIDLGLVDVDLRVFDSARGASTAFVSSWGSAVFVQELSDSTTKEVQMSFAVKRSIPGGVYYGGARSSRDWTKIERTFDDMMRDLQEGLANVVPTGTGAPLAGCSGRLQRILSGGATG